MRRLAMLTVAFILAAWPLLAQAPGGAPYKIHFDRNNDVKMEDKVAPGSTQSRIWLNVRFSISVENAPNDPPGTVYKVIIEENGKPVKILDVPQPAASEDLSAVLCLDTSGSMSEGGRMEQARKAAYTFLDNIPAKGECGLILFDHVNRDPIIKPTTNRKEVREQIDRVQPRGGTAYLDAGYTGIQMLKNLPDNREKAVVIVTDGIDLNSLKTAEAVIDQAKRNRVRIFTIGIGEPGKFVTVSTALVLDHSGSMAPPADDKDKTPKIKALHEAGSRFVKTISSKGRVTLVPFSSTVRTPSEFGEKKDAIKLSNIIKSLQPEGETALFDAVYTALATLEADNTPGTRVVVAMTDGVDNTSRRRVEEVIERAKEANIKLYMLGFGRQEELDDSTMKLMAESTGGKFYHARNAESLIEIFEKLSSEIHDVGIDEKTLIQLANETGGKYYLAQDVNQLQLILKQVTQSMQRKPYNESFESLYQQRDGTRRIISIKLVRGDGKAVAEMVEGSILPPGFQDVAKVTSDYGVSGVVIAEMNHLIYLLFLAVLAAMIALPAWLKSLSAKT